MKLFDKGEIYGRMRIWTKTLTKMIEFTLFISEITHTIKYTSHQISYIIYHLKIIYHPYPLIFLFNCIINN